MDASLEFLTEQLKSKNIRPSFQRVKVLEYLYQKGGHPTVDDIFRALSGEIPSLSKVTIYNTLHTLVEASLVRVVDIDEAEKRFDITLSNHGHFQCEACKTVYNFQVNIDQVPIEGLGQFEITQKNIYFKGLCPNCLSQAKRNQPA
jgi:Fur family transcriptional regulator, peroxide stress response regulator